VKRRPGYSEEQIDNEAILLRAYGKGTEVLIDRERRRSLLSKEGSLLKDKQAKQRPTPFYRPTT